MIYPLIQCHGIHIEVQYMFENDKITIPQKLGV